MSLCNGSVEMALQMRADVSIELLAARQRMQKRAAAGGGGESSSTRNADGTFTQRIRSLSELKSVLKR